MANFAASILAKGQTVVTAKNQAPELRRKNPTVMGLALKNSEYSIPNAPELRKSDLRPVEIYYKTKQTQGAGTTKAYNHTGNYSDSGKVELVYISHVETFNLPRKLANNNVFSYQQLFNHQYEESWRNLRNRHDTSALAFLIANRMQLSAAVVNPQIVSANPGTWNDTTYALEVDQTKKARFMQMAKIFMAARYFTSTLDVIADLQTAAEFEFQMQQGQANNTNFSFQFAGASIGTTQDVVSNSYTQGAGLFLPSGAFSGMYWNDRLNISGVNSGENEIGMLGTTSDPFGSSAVADLSMYTKRADTSANTTGGSTQDIVDQWELTLTIAYALPPLSATGDSVVHLIGQSS
jgi:hypothetical protein